MNNLKSEYENIYPKDSKMVEYCLKNVCEFVVFNNGSILTIDKPTIEKRFCFSTGYNCQIDKEMEKSADEMYNLAKTNNEYFINENMKNFEHIENLINKYENGYKILATEKYFKKTNFVYLSDGDRLSDSEIKESYELCQDDINKIKKALTSSKTKFLKRINTYLKKYGLSKLRVWKYLSD